MSKAPPPTFIQSSDPAGFLTVTVYHSSLLKECCLCKATTSTKDKVKYITAEGYSAELWKSGGRQVRPALTHLCADLGDALSLLIEGKLIFVADKTQTLGSMMVLNSTI